MNHGFFDGNKRVGFIAMAVSMSKFYPGFKFNNQEVGDVCLKVAASQMSREELLAWLKQKLCEYQSAS